jgi:hypothetical protein
VRDLSLKWDLSHTVIYKGNEESGKIEEVWETAAEIRIMEK